MCRGKKESTGAGVSRKNNRIFRLEYSQEMLSFQASERERKREGGGSERGREGRTEIETERDRDRESEEES